LRSRCLRPLDQPRQVGTRRQRRAIGAAPLFCLSFPRMSVGDTCVDATEVTRNQYATWLETSPSTAEQVDECLWNASFEPDATCMADSVVCAADCGEHPQVCVDWCEAAAYCVSAGKRLCEPT